MSIPSVSQMSSRPSPSRSPRSKPKSNEAAPWPARSKNSFPTMKTLACIVRYRVVPARMVPSIKKAASSGGSWQSKRVADLKLDLVFEDCRQADAAGGETGAPRITGGCEASAQ